MEMFGQIKVDIGKILQQLCQQKGIEIIEVKLKLMPPSWAYVLARLEELNSNFQNEKVLVRNDFSSGCLFYPSVPREASEMFQCIKYEDKREVFGFKIHSFSTLDRIKKYDDSDSEENAEKPYSIKVGETKRTINLYAIATTKFQIAV